MSLEAENLDRWYDTYSAAAPKQQYEMLQTLLETSLSPEAIEEMDLGMLLLEMREELVNNNQIEEAIAFLEKIQHHQPALYQEEYPYHDKFLVRYYLWCDRPDKVAQALTLFKQSPAIGIDELLLVLDDLCFYNAAELAVDLCRSAYRGVADSPDILNGTENYLSEVILTDSIEQAYRQLQQGETVDWEGFWTELKPYGYDENADVVTSLPQDLTTTVEANEQLFKDFKKKPSRETLIRHISLDFYKSMAEQKQVSFVCARAIWQTLFDFLTQRDLSPKKLSSPDSFFGFSQKELDRYVANQLGPIFSIHQSAGVAALWGVPYLYDFLSDRSIIRPEIHRRAIAAATNLKQLFTKNFKALWKFDFIHRWQPPDSVSAAEFDAEGQKFAQSLFPAIPLSGEPRPNQFDLEQYLPKELEIQSDRPSKPSKPKKSAMKLAAELYKKKSPAKTKKKR